MASRKHTYRVEHAGQVFTRTTARIYTHVVVARDSYEKRVASAKATTAYDCREKNHNYYKDQAARDPNAPARYHRIAAVTQQQWHDETLAKRIAELDALKAEGHFDRFVALTWCGRPDRAAAETRNCINYGWIDVQAIPVPAI